MNRTGTRNVQLLLLPIQVRFQLHVYVKVSGWTRNHWVCQLACRDIQKFFSSYTVPEMI